MGRTGRGSYEFCKVTPAELELLAELDDPGEGQTE